MPLKLPATLWVPGPMPGLNELMDARMRGANHNDARGRIANNYSQIKKQWNDLIGYRAIQQGIREPLLRSVALTFVHHELTRQRDPDNFCMGAQKLIQDALVKMRVMRSDGWRWLSDFRHYWTVARARERVGVLVILDEDVWERGRALAVPDGR